MPILLKTLKKSTRLLLVTVLVISAFVAYATYVDRTVYKTERLVIIPDSVTSDSWLGLDSVLVQDISEYSLYQDFTEKNAAYISELGVFSREKVTDEPESPATDDPDSSMSSTSPVDTPIGSEIDAPITNESDTATVDEDIVPVENEASTPEATESTDAPATAPEQDEAIPDPDMTYRDMPKQGISLLPKALPFPLAQAILEEPISVTSDTVQADESETVVEPPNETIPDDADLNTAPVDAISDDVEPVDDVSLSVTPAEGSTDTATSAPTEVTSSTSAQESAGSESDETREAVSEASGSDFVLAPCLVEELCKTYSMLFTGFTLPEFESGTVLDSMQLRLSLAAQTKRNRTTGPQRYIIEYSYDTATTAKQWQTASVIDIDDEISNSINGGYFLITLDAPKHSGEIANLNVRVSYQGDVSQLDRAYVEGVWLEVTSGTFYESDDVDPYSDRLKSDRMLAQPQFNTLNQPDIDPTLGTLPSFTLSYDPQQNFFTRMFNRIFSENTFTVDQITVSDAEGNLIEVPVAVVYNDDTTWTLQVKKQPQSLKPGKYTVTATMFENDEPYVDSFEFYWGLLAVNTKKSMYFPNEKVELNLAALTDDGTTICDADLHMQIVDPKGEIFDVPVEQSGSCGPDNVTDIPDYVAHFTNTGEWGVYSIMLENRNVAGEVVHKVQDSFEVRDYIPFDIERTAPTRIYPPAPYAVGLHITAHRDFTGDINERVPRGFVMNDIAGAVISTLPEYTLITWKDVTMKEGDELQLSYTFDAPDISPYMYLLGPLDMDGFAELRQWQIASDALNNIGFFTGTRTVAGTNLNAAPSPMQWSTSSVDSYYYSHSTSSDSHVVTLRQAGDYLVSVTLPQQRVDGNVSRTRGSIEVRVNGVAVPQGVGRSGYIVNTGAHSESSSHVSFLLTGVQENDYIEVFEENIDTVDVGDTLNVTNQAAMYLEYIRSTETVFAATSTETTNSTNLNQVTAYPMKWTETRQDSGFVHSDTVTPENIMISASGTYMVHVNIPITGVGHTVQQNITGKVLLDGVQVTGGRFQQGYIETAATEGEGDASIHWSGVIVATTTNQVLTITAEREAGAGTTTVTPGFVGSIFVEKLPATGVIAVTGRDLTGVGGTNWNPTFASTTKFVTQLSYDNTAFTHSTTTNNHQITVTASGDYLLTVNTSATGTTANTNNRITVQVASSSYPGAQTKSNYIRAQNGHSDSSGSLVYLLEGITAGQIVTVSTQAEATAGTVNDNTDTVVMLWKKAALNVRAPSPTMANTPFDNIRFASTTPFFYFQSNDPDGSSDIQYEFSISTSSDFASSTTKLSGTDAGFYNTASSTDTSPFTESNQIRYQLQSADTLTDLTTYYWRVRAKDVQDPVNLVIGPQLKASLLTRAMLHRIGSKLRQDSCRAIPS